MSFTFKADVLGVQMDITGEFLAAEPEKGLAGVFELHKVEHKGEELDFDGLHDNVIDFICEDALKAACSAAAEYFL